MKRINAKAVDLEKVRETLTDMNNEKGVLGLTLLEELEFQRRTLKRMREDIDNDSIEAEYNSYKRSNPIIAGYNAMIKNYSQVLRQVVELLPAEAQTSVSVEELLNEEY